MLIREAEQQDLSQLLRLYTHLGKNPLPIIDETIEVLWNEFRDDPRHHMIVGLVGKEIVSSCVLMIVPNLTHKQRPYALVENVINPSRISW